MSKRSQAYILIKQGYSVRDTAQLIGKLSFFVQKWSKRGENGTFQRKKDSGRPKISSKILITLEKSKYKRYQSTRNSVESQNIQRQCQQMDVLQSILCPRDKRLTRSIMLKTLWKRKLSPC